MKNRISWILAAAAISVIALLGCSGNGGSGPLSGDFYVRAGEAGVGTLESPFGSVQDAIDAASAPATILVAAGTYTEDIVLKDGVSLFGGCNADFTDRLYRTEANRENPLYRTVLQSPKTSGGSSLNPNTSFSCSRSITEFTVVQGFTILSGSAIVTAAVRCDNGASPIFDSNTIAGMNDGFDVTAAYGVFIKGSSPTFINNVIIGRDGGSDTSIGVYCDNYPTNSLVLLGNSIYGGDETLYSVGVKIYSAGEVLLENNSIVGGHDVEGVVIGIEGGSEETTIKSNRISAGSLTETATGDACGIKGVSDVIRNNLICGGIGTSKRTWGIFFYGGASTDVANNTICGGSGIEFAVGILGNGPISIRNNIVFTTAAGNGSSHYNGIGISENTRNSNPLALRNNVIFDCPKGLYLNMGTYGVEAVGYPEINDYSYTTQSALAPSSGNLSEDLLDVDGTDHFVDFTGPDGEAGTLDDNDWRLTASALLAVRGGGLDLSAEFTDDFDGAVRTTGTPTGAANADAGGWSMGALERD